VRHVVVPFFSRPASDTNATAIALGFTGKAVAAYGDIDKIPYSVT